MSQPMGLARGVALGLGLLYTHFIQPNELGMLAITGIVTLPLASTLGMSISSGASRTRRRSPSVMPGRDSGRMQRSQYLKTRATLAERGPGTDARRAR